MLRALVVLLSFVLAAPALSSSNDASWRQDVQYLATELAKRHRNAFFHTPRETFDAATAALIADVPTLSDAQVQVRVMQLVASIGDAHTSLWGVRFSRLPFDVYSFSDGYFVHRATAEQQDLIGTRLISIGNRPLDEVVAAVATVIPHENEMWLRAQLPARLVLPEVLHALGITSDPSWTLCVFEGPDGQRIERTLAALPDASAASWVLRPDETVLYRRNAELNYWFEYLPESRTLFIKYNVCREMSSKPVVQLRDEIRATMAANPVDRVVLDVRHNGGGNSQVFYPVMLDFQDPEIDRSDRLFVITGRLTFSSALLNVLQLAQASNATFVGEPTGGKPNGYGEVLTFVLPYSGLTVQYSTKYFMQSQDSDPPSFVPDVHLPLSSRDFFAARDPVLEWIVAPRPKRRSVR